MHRAMQILMYTLGIFISGETSNPTASAPAAPTADASNVISDLVAFTVNELRDDPEGQGTDATIDFSK